MNKKEGILEAHMLYRLMHFCVQKEAAIDFVFLSIRNSLICPSKDLIPRRSSDLEVTFKIAWGHCLLHTLGIAKGLGN